MGGCISKSAKVKSSHESSEDKAKRLKQAADAKLNKAKSDIVTDRKNFDQWTLETKDGTLPTLDTKNLNTFSHRAKAKREKALKTIHAKMKKSDRSYHTVHHAELVRFIWQRLFTEFKTNDTFSAILKKCNAPAELIETLGEFFANYHDIVQDHGKITNEYDSYYRCDDDLLDIIDKTFNGDNPNVIKPLKDFIKQAGHIFIVEGTTFDLHENNRNTYLVNNLSKINHSEKKQRTPHGTHDLINIMGLLMTLSDVHHSILLPERWALKKNQNEQHMTPESSPDKKTALESPLAPTTVTFREHESPIHPQPPSPNRASASHMIDSTFPKVYDIFERLTAYDDVVYGSDQKSPLKVFIDQYPQFRNEDGKLNHSRVRRFLYRITQSLLMNPEIQQMGYGKLDGNDLILAQDKVKMLLKTISSGKSCSKDVTNIIGSIDSQIKAHAKESGNKNLFLDAAESFIKGFGFEQGFALTQQKAIQRIISIFNKRYDIDITKVYPVAADGWNGWQHHSVDLAAFQTYCQTLDKQSSSSSSNGHNSNGSEKKHAVEKPNTIAIMKQILFLTAQRLEVYIIGQNSQLTTAIQSAHMTPKREFSGIGARSHSLDSATIHQTIGAGGTHGTEMKERQPDTDTAVEIVVVNKNHGHRRVKSILSTRRSSLNQDPLVSCNTSTIFVKVRPKNGSGSSTSTSETASATPDTGTL